MKILETLSQGNHNAVKLTIQTEMEFSKRKQSTREPDTKMEFLLMRPPNNITSLMEQNKFVK